MSPLMSPLVSSPTSIKVSFRFLHLDLLLWKSLDLSIATSRLSPSVLPPPLFPPLLHSHLTSPLLLFLPCLSNHPHLRHPPPHTRATLLHLSSYWPRSQLSARPQGLFPVCPGAGGNLSRETNCLVAASCEHLAQLGMWSQVTPPETEHRHAHTQTRARRHTHTHSRQCCHLLFTTMGHKVMWCKMINELVRPDVIIKCVCALSARVSVCLCRQQLAIKNSPIWQPSVGSD